MITQDLVRELFYYNPNTGTFEWAKDYKRQKRGSTAGTADNRGYISINVGGKKYWAHRLIWLYWYGYLPEKTIDHIDRNKSNNKLLNLREASRSCNARNTSERSTNKTGITGVCWSKQRNKWAAQITLNTVAINLGCYVDFADAVCARLAAEQCLDWPGCNSSTTAFKYVSACIKRR